jgi:O-antigen ligase
MVSFNRVSSEKITELFFLNLFILPVYPDNLKPTFIVLFLITAIYNVINKRNIIFKLYSKITSLLLINSSLFLVLLISLIYSNNVTFGLSYIFRSLPLLLFPIAFYFLKDNKNVFSPKVFIKAKLFFYISTLVLFISFFFIFYFRGFVTENYFLNYSYRIIFQLGRYSMHPIYASLITSISLIFSISLFKIKRYKLLLILGNILLVFNLILLSRKSAIIIMSILFFLFITFNKKIKFKIKAFFVFIILMLFFVTIKFIPDISNRFNDFESLFDSTKASSTNLRLNLLSLSLEAIKEKPFFGYGVGDTKDFLSSLELKNAFFKGKYYNTHNQFLAVAFATGAFGFIIFILFLLKNIKLVISRSFEQLSIVLLFVSLMFIENILDRQNGIIYFSIFINYFSFYNVINNVK